MVPMGGTDEWIAGIASFVRTSFGNNATMITPEDVARVRSEVASRTTPWTVAELEASLPRALDSQQWKLSASHGVETTSGALTLRGWTTDAPQTAGMWFTVELPQAVVVTEVQFDSIGVIPRPARGAAPPAPGAAGGRGAAVTTPIVQYPRGYSLQVSEDGSTWSKPVAEGKGKGAHTTVSFAPTRAKFVRLTQTDTVADAPPWSIRNLRIYEAPATPATK
jgi:hypothetical protein